MSSAMVSSIPLFHPIAEGDVVFEAWLTARNARTLLTEPHRPFDTPHCAPAEKTLTLGVPMITMGLLATPVALFTRNPALAYNFSIFCLLVVTALAMFLLIREWTGNAAAGIIAGLLFAAQTFVWIRGRPTGRPHWHADDDVPLLLLLAILIAGFWAAMVEA